MTGSMLRTWLDASVRTSLVAGIIMLTGCSDSSALTLKRRETAPTADVLLDGTIVGDLASEAHAIRDLLSWTDVLYAIVVVTLGWVAIRLVHRSVRFAWKTGRDRKRHLAVVRSTLNATILALIITLLVRRLLTAAPIMTLVALVVMIAVTTAALSNSIRNVYAGFVLAFRKRIRTGDRITTSGQVGIVIDIGFTQVTLRGADGTVVMVPNYQVVSSALHVEKVKDTETVTVRSAEVRDPSVLQPRVLKQIRRAGLLSPFRVPATNMDVRIVEPRSIQVTMQVWAKKSTRDAQDHVEALMHAVLESEQAEARKAAVKRSADSATGP